MLEHSPHSIHFYKVKTHSGIIGNERADACARTAALTDTTDIALPDARDPLHNFYWLSLKTSHAQNDGMHRSHAFPIYYLTNLNDKLKIHMHKSTSLALLQISLDNITIAGKGSTMPYNPVPKSPPPTLKLTTQTVNLLTKR
eukprot:1140561-Pelagomonas_calceolata.AAC.1